MPSAKRILLVDDDEMLRASLAEQFARPMGRTNRSRREPTARAIRRALKGSTNSWCWTSRSPMATGANSAAPFAIPGVTCPIIILTASDSDADTIDGLKAGANDYITKPFRFAVLMARVDAHLRSHGTSEEAIYRIGPYTFRPSAKVLVEGGKRIRLTEKETNILKYLQRAGSTVSRDVLLHEVWGYNPAVSTHTLETHIYRLRQKIEKDPSRAQLLITESGGYRLNP